MKNKFFNIIFALALAVSVLAGCGGGGGGGGSENPAGPDTSTSTSTSTSTGTETDSSTGTGTDTSTGTGTGTDTSTGTGTGTGTGTDTATWANVTSETRIQGIWQNKLDYKLAGGEIEKTWKDTGNGIPSIEFTSDYGENLEIDGNVINSPLKSNTAFYDEASVASDSAEIWTTAAAENLETYYMINNNGAPSQLIYIIDPSNASSPVYLKRTYNILIMEDEGEELIKLYDDITSDYLILKKIP